MRLFFLIFLTILFSFVQTTGFSIFGVKPNLALMAVVAVSFFISDIWEGFLLVLMSALILKFGPEVGNKEIIIFSLIGAAAVFSKRYLIWQQLINCLILLVVATLLFYVFLSPSFIFSRIFLQEISYNIISGIIIFASLRWLKKIYF